MKMARVLSTIFLASFLSFLGAQTASAALTINTQVSVRPANMSDLSLTQFVDSLNESNSHYLGDDPIIFKLHITNTGSESLLNVGIVGRPPTYLIPPQNGLLGWDANTHTVVAGLPILGPNQSYDFLYPMRVVSNSDLPGNPPNTFCVTSAGEVAARGTASASDDTQFCIEKVPAVPGSPTPTPGTNQARQQPTATPTKKPEVQGTATTSTPTPTAKPNPTAAPAVTEVPRTGPSAGALVGALEFVALGAGIAIRRRVS